MARFNYSGVAITAGSGRLNSSLGGTVLLSNGVVRNYVTPVNPQTAPQILTRGVFNFYTTKWSILTESQRQAWVDAAASGAWNITDTFRGTSRNPTGKTLYVQLNVNLFFMVGDYSQELSLPPTKEDYSSLTMGAVTMYSDTVSTANMVFSGSPGLTEMIEVFATPPLSAGTMKPKKNTFRLIQSVTAASPVTFGPSYTTKFGDVSDAVGQKVFLKFYQCISTTGQKRLLGQTEVILAEEP